MLIFAYLLVTLASEYKENNIILWFLIGFTLNIYIN